MSLLQVNERSAARIVVGFSDFDGPAVPDSVTYAVYDVETGTLLRGDTPLTPGLTATITLVNADTQIVTEAKSSELHEVLIKAVLPEGEANTSYRFAVVNLPQITGPGV